MAVKRNEIWWAELPEPAGRRPVLLLSRQDAYAVRRKLIAAEITTRVRGTPCEVRVGRGEGLPRASVANLESLLTIPRDWLRMRAGALGRAKIGQVNDALRFALDLP
jgi:mRNA interferase MazF